MPELPEVECLVNALRPLLEGAQITKIKFYRNDLREPLPIKEFAKYLEGQTLLTLDRRGKYMLWETKNDVALFHLGMSGRFNLEQKSQPLKTHTHVVFSVKSQDQKNYYLHYVDPRRFGRMGFHLGHDVSRHKFIEKLGLEPLESSQKVGKYLFESSRRCRQPIKTFLMNSHRLVGVGNIYASEALFRAKISPFRDSSSLDNSDFLRLSREIKTTLQAAIKAGGTTLRDYVHPEGQQGQFQISLKVYGREGKPCVECQKLVTSARQGGRSTFYCQQCQN